jgi:hypothetical protein
MALLHDESPFIQRVGLEFDTQLHDERLRDALDRLARRHPILTATVDRSTSDARWEPGTTAPELVAVADDNPGDRFLSPLARASLTARALDPTTGPTCSVVHVDDRDGARSRLVFGMHHSVVDARGVALLLDDLRSFYVALQRDEDPVVDVDWSPRTLGALLAARHSRLDERARRAWDAAQRWATVPRSTHCDPAPTTGDDGSDGSDGSDGEYAIRFDATLISAIEAAARTRGWRFNHVVLTLLARAWTRVFGREPVEPSVSGWLVTVDCRRQFGVARGAGNLSGLEPVSLVDVDTRDPVEAIARTTAAFAALTRDGAGLAAELAPRPPALLDQAMRDTFALRTRTFRLSRLYTAARFPPSLEHWGHATATGLRWVVPERAVPPYVAMALVRFAGVTTIAPVAAPEVFPRASASALGAEMQRELAQLASTL